MLSVDEFRAAVARSRWFRPRTVVRCPHCRGRLGGWAKLVVASKHCPHCGGRVLADPPLPADLRPPDEFTPEPEYKQAVDLYEGRAVAIGVGGGLLGLLWWTTTGEAIARKLSATVHEAVGGAVGFLVFLTPVSWAWVAMTVLRRRARLDDRLNCWACDAFLVPGALGVRLTGCCHCCGVRVLDAPAGDAAEALATRTPVLPTVSGFVAREADRAAAERRVGVWLVVGMAAWAVPLAALEATGNRWLFGVGLAAGGAGVLAGVATVAVRNAVRFPRRCPCCNAGWGETGTVVATRHCPHCWRRALAEG